VKWFEPAATAAAMHGVRVFSCICSDVIFLASPDSREVRALLVVAVEYPQ